MPTAPIHPGGDNKKGPSRNTQPLAASRRLRSSSSNLRTRPDKPSGCSFAQSVSSSGKRIVLLIVGGPGVGLRPGLRFSKFIPIVYRINSYK